MNAPADIRLAVLLVDATIGRVQAAARNQKNTSMLRVWCASIVGDLEEALRILEEIAPLEEQAT